MSRKLGYVRTLGRLLFSVGYMLLLEGDYERGAALNEEAAALYRERGYKGGLDIVLDNLGWAALLQGDPERARSYYQESLMLCKELGDKRIASESLEGLACLASSQGEAERAAKLFGAAEALGEAVDSQHMPEEAAWREPYLAAARSRLDEAAWDEAWAARASDVYGAGHRIRPLGREARHAPHLPTRSNPPPTNRPASPVARRKWRSLWAED